LATKVTKEEMTLPTAGWTEWCGSSDNTSPLTYTVYNEDRCKNCDAGKYKDVIENTECTRA